jgi:cytochrome-b5 reductase
LAVIRSYTPVSKPEEKGYFELLMKKYTFGKMSSYLFDLREGDCLDVRGPVGRFKYRPNMYSCIGLVCGGTGLTPGLQVIREVLQGSRAAEESTRLVLLYQNRTKEDILMQDTLCELEREFPDRLQVHFFLSSPPVDWGSAEAEVGVEAEAEAGVGREHRGYISEDSMRALLPAASTDLVGLCGPSGFNEAMVQKLEVVGFDKDKDLYVW